MERSFYYEDGRDNLYDEKSTKVYDPMEGVLTEITNPTVVLERLTDQSTWRKLKPPEKIAVERIAKVMLIKPAKKEYRKYSDRQRKDFPIFYFNKKLLAHRILYRTSNVLK